MNDEQRRILEFVSTMNQINGENNPLNPKVHFVEDGSTDLVFREETTNFKTYREILEHAIADISQSGFRRGFDFARSVRKIGELIKEEGPSEDDRIM